MSPAEPYSPSFIQAVQGLQTHHGGLMEKDLGEIGDAKLREEAFTQRIKWIMEKIPERARVLDLGCGKGEMLHFLYRYRGIRHLGLERDEEFVEGCRKLGLNVVPSDLNNLEDDNLRYACSQHWDVALIIDSLCYWLYPAAILTALKDRCEVIYISVGNHGHIKQRWKCLLGKMSDFPNYRGYEGKFTLDWFVHKWTVQGFVEWCNKLGFECCPIARRSVRAAYLPLGISPSLFAKSVLFRLKAS